jgi:uncharacterized RDD family membrane protein YckC
MSMGGLPYNPYAPPNAEPGPTRKLPGSHALATRGQRLAGAIVDGLFALVLGFVPALALHMAGYDPFPSKLPSGSPLHWMPSGTLSALVGLVPASYQWWLITRSGQTLGKKVVKTRIVTMAGDVVGFSRGVLLRNVPLHMIQFVNTLVYVYAPSMHVVAWVLGVLPTIDPLFIFGPSRRCLHDYLAGTQVVSEDPSWKVAAV